MRQRVLWGVLALLAVNIAPVQAGGTIGVFNNQPLRFSASKLPIKYQTDQGSLGSLTNAQALSFVTTAFQPWQDIPDSNISYQNVGPLSEDITDDNFFELQDERFDQCVNNLNPASYVVFDTDGSIVDLIFGVGSSDDILGFAGPDCITNNSEIIYSLAVLNGQFSNDPGFKSAFIHEFGHLSGLDHTLLESVGAVDFTNIPTMYSFLFGAQQESLELDDRSWMSNFYPASSFSTNYGTITGKVLLGDGVTGFDGALVVARKVGGIPQKDAVSVISGYLNNAPNPNFQGTFTLPGLPPGQYTVDIQPINPSEVSTISFYSTEDGNIPVFPVGAVKEFYNVGESASDNPNTSTILTVNAGGTLANINIILNKVSTPTNDNFINAIGLAGNPITISSSNVDATKEAGEPNHANNSGGRSVWWTWTAPATGSVTINTIGSAFDTTLGVYTGTAVNALTTIASNDDSGGNGTSTVTFNALGGTVYRIAVDGFSGSSGNIVLNLQQAVVNTAPTISSYNPLQGPVGTSVVITGTNFSGATAVRFNGIAASFTVNSSTQITATVPGGATTGPLSVTTPSGTVTGGFFTVTTTTVTPPTVTDLFPAVGPPTTRLTLTGNNLTGVTGVLFNGLPAAFTLLSSTQLAVTVPAILAGTPTTVTVTTAGGTSSPFPFRVAPYNVRSELWQMVGSADFNNDGQSDILWRNYTTGENALWFMNGTAFAFSVLLNSVTDPNWQLVAAVDFTLDGQPDLLWRNYATGENALWQMNGTTFVAGYLIDTVTDRNWQLVGAADYSGDGKPDLLWRNYTDSSNAIWLMNGTSYAGAAPLGQIDLSWQMVSQAITPRQGSFNLDPQADILWRNLSSAESAVWLMNGTALTAGVLLPALPDLNWQLIGSGDFNGDNQADLLWRNYISGDNAIWLMNGTGLITGIFFGNVPAN